MTKSGKRSGRNNPTGRTPARRRPGSPLPAYTQVLVLEVHLQEVEPRVWRRIEVPETQSFYELHVAIQDAMGWDDAHLHEFRVAIPSRRPLRIGYPDDEWPEGRETVLGWSVPIAAHLAQPGARVLYVYDFGDGWHHDVRFVARATRGVDVEYPRCTAGERACPPEDVGGPPGFFEFPNAIRDTSHEEHDDLLLWAGGSYDPAAFDPTKLRFNDPRARWRVAMEE
jgi:hypothetical protein